MNLYKQVPLWISALIQEAWQASLPLIKITIPVVILVRIFSLVGLDTYINDGLRPFMVFVNLPPEAGIVWASALVGNLYSAVLVFLSHATGLGMTTAQVTVLLTMVLVAHSFPMELRVSQVVGINPIYMGLLRFLGAVMLGWCLFKLYAQLGIHQEVAPLPNISNGVKVTSAVNVSWVDWASGELRNLVVIYFIVLAITAFMKLLRALSIDVLLEHVLWPLNALLGTHRKTTSFNVIGMIAGISYGSALMLQELKRNKFTNRDILITMTFMGLAHGLIEETLLMVALNADWKGLLWGRVLLACVAAIMIGLLLKLIPTLIEKPLFLNNRLLTESGELQK